VGRFDVHGSSARYAWSGSTVEVRFRGGSIAVRLRSAPLAPRTVRVAGKDVTIDEKTTPYAVFVDGRRMPSLDVTHETERYVLARGLAPSVPHVARLVREAEASAGVHEVLGFELPDGGALLPPAPRRIRLVFVGDSITCGYGVLGDDARCPFTYATERATLAYGALVGDAMDADVTTLCWSGRGLYRNYDGSTTETMPVLFDRTLPDRTAPVAFDFREPEPDALVVNLGTNDLLSPRGGAADLPTIEDAYAAFLGHVRDVHPRAFVLVVGSPMLPPEAVDRFGREPLRAIGTRVFARAVARRREAGDARVAFLDPGWQGGRVGCDYHPNAAMHATMAEEVIAELRAAVR
jgi:lysophospholipase L1-like esterase